jgi:hypothetical protein
MIQFLRKNQRGFMLVVAFLTIVAFAFLYNTTQLDELANVRNPTIYGKNLTQLSIDRQIKNYQLTMALGQYDLLQKLGGTASDPDQALNDYVWNLLVLRHEADTLGVDPTDNQVADSIKSLQVFQTSGQFDPIKYSQFVSEQLAPRGFNERQLEEVMRDSLRVERLSLIVTSPAAVGENEIANAAKIFQPITANYIRFDRDLAGKGIEISADEISFFHKENQASLQSNETRDILVAEFSLPVGEPLKGKARVEALQKLAESATRAIDALEGGTTSLETVAKSIPDSGVRTFKGMTRSGEIDFNDSLATISQEDIRTLASAAYALPKEGNFSDIIQIGDTFQIVQLTKINEARPLTLEEATPRIRTALLSQKAAQQFSASSGAAYNAIKTALANGKSLQEAAASQNLSVLPLTNIVPAGESTSQEQRLLSASTLILKDGELSPLEQAPWGSFTIQLVSRGKASEDLEKQNDTIREDILAGKRDLLFQEWLRTSREAARITTPSTPQG